MRPSRFELSPEASLCWQSAYGMRGRYLARQPAGWAEGPCGWPSSVDALVEWIETHRDVTLAGHDLSLDRHARAAATLARRDGACDALIAAAVVHDLPFTDAQPTHPAWLPMPWLRTLFDDNVLGPVRLLNEARTHRQVGDPASREAFLRQPHAARALRLAGFDEAARRPEAVEAALPWSALLPVLRRCALD